MEIGPDRLDRVDPGSAVVSQLLPAEAGHDIRATGCAHGHFFSSAAAAAEWLADHPGGHLAAVADEFDRCRQIAAALGWIPSQPRP